MTAKGRGTRMTAKGTGIYYQAQHVDRIPDYDPRSGNHYWTIGCLFSVNPETPNFLEEVHLDSENLAYTSPPGCWYCEEAYTPRLAKRRCPGKPA